MKVLFRLLLCFVALPLAIFSQADPFSDNKAQWADNKPVHIPESFNKYKNSDLVIISEKNELKFYIHNISFDNDEILNRKTSGTARTAVGPARYAGGRYASGTDMYHSENTATLARSMVVKINNEKGLEAIKHMRLPESFDLAYDASRFKQGRLARISVPYIIDYKVTLFMARKYNNRWSDVHAKDRYEQVRWIMTSGEFENEDTRIYELQNLQVGDVLELYYEARFSWDYGNNLFYFNSAYPKLECEYDITYQVPKGFLNYDYILPMNLPDSAVVKTHTLTQNNFTQTEKIVLHDLKGINYPANSFEGKNLPHVFVDFQFEKAVVESFPDQATRVFEYRLVRPYHFEWTVSMDTTNNYVKIYDKHFSTLRKFVSGLPKPGSDSANVEFFKALCDTFNSFRFYTMNHLAFNEPALAGIASEDHLMKRRLVSETMWKLYRDILNDNHIFYYLVNVEDNRYGEHNTSYRAHFPYEGYLIAVPYKDSYFYFMPRYFGLKYHLGELPFYYEGAIGALKPYNFQRHVKNKEELFFKFIKTHQGTYNENTRTENATASISLDSARLSLMTKESLSGQFSTVLRHLYLNELIDSTIAPYYFKKCTDKPHASGEKIKLSSRITDYPYRYTFNCNEQIRLMNPNYLDLSNWFSFLLSKQIIPGMPSHDYYFDFQFSDNYNFLLNFNQPVELANAAAFTKKVQNDVFELESGIVKNSERAYLLKVHVAVKKPMIAEQDMPLLMSLIKDLDELNHFSLEVVKK